MSIAQCLPPKFGYPDLFHKYDDWEDKKPPKSARPHLWRYVIARNLLNLSANSPKMKTISVMESRKLTSFQSGSAASSPDWLSARYCPSCRCMSQLGVTSHESALHVVRPDVQRDVLVSAIVSPMWVARRSQEAQVDAAPRLAGMAIAILLEPRHQRLAAAYSAGDNGADLRAFRMPWRWGSQVPRERSAAGRSARFPPPRSAGHWRPAARRLPADHVGLRAVFIITAILLAISFLGHPFLIKEGGRPVVSKSERLGGKAVSPAALSPPDD